MGKFIRLILLLLVITTGIAAWLSLGSGTAFAEKNKYFIIEEGKTTKEDVLELLGKKYIVKHPTAFGALATALNVWGKIKPGKYEVKHGENLLSIARMLKNGKQAEIPLIINKIRLKEDLAKLIGKNFSTDSAHVMEFLTNNQTLERYQVDTNTVFTLIMPDKYNFYWNTSLENIFDKLMVAHNNFWSKNNRKEKAAAIGLSEKEVYILASIVEEETNWNPDRSNIASVYLNRLNKNMALGACPTIKYAMRDFSLSRIYEKYTFTPSPYNTYRHTGLPPGPICTPSTKCIDIVLDAPKTDYLYFVANASLDGKHHFSNTYAEHMTYAKQYQKALDEYQARKKANQQP